MRDIRLLSLNYLLAAISAGKNMNDSRRVDLYWVLVALVSAFLGFLAGRNHSFQFYKLLNFLGLVYGFIAVLLLSYAVLATEKIQDLLAHHISLAIISFTLIFPIGFCTGMFFGRRTLDINVDFYAFVFISIFPTFYIYTSPVLEPFSYRNFNAEKRIKILGAILLLMAFAFQAVSAFTDTFLLTKLSI